MGNGIVRNIAGTGKGDREQFTTALLILALLNQKMPTPMSTYELGLWITDSQDPPRPLSVIVKTLSVDGYITKAASAGKRAALWAITERGVMSLHSRAEKHKAAEAWIADYPGYSRDECAVMNSLLIHGNQSPKLLADSCLLLISPVRTALKKLIIRELATKPANPTDGYALTERGRNVALDRRHEMIDQRNLDPQMEVCLSQ